MYTNIVGYKEWDKALFFFMVVKLKVLLQSKQLAYIFCVYCFVITSLMKACTKSWVKKKMNI